MCGVSTTPAVPLELRFLNRSFSFSTLALHPSERPVPGVSRQGTLFPLFQQGNFDSLKSRIFGIIEDMKIPREVESAFPVRPFAATKYSVGTVTIVGGSGHYIHAPVISALGARAAGAGLVQLVVPDASRIAAGVHVPEATFTKLTLACVPPKADVTVAGMGLSTGLNAQAILSRILSGSSGRFVLDADALTILAGWYAESNPHTAVSGQELVLTPHEGEAARLLGVRREKVSADRSGAAHALAARYHATIVLKGPDTLVVSADGRRVYKNGTGNPAMALGGMGDLLSGVLGARWAYLRGDAFTAACAAVWLHGAASDNLVAAGGDPSLANTAAALGSLRARLDRGEGAGAE
ncbi:MAG TPA: NAD(P)H-hydrate dehydratase [Verrucomicrobia bacterium]|nr:NAD(P)H-hydrate dehydratase [Verrucomicrobiota bacterium]